MLLAALLPLVLATTPQNWTTPAEQSGYTQTPRYAETMAYFERLDSASNQLCMQTFGTSPQGRALQYLVISHDGECTAQQVHDSGKEIILIQTAIHAGENEGKDAMMAFARDLSVLGQHRDLLRHVTLVAIPIFNVDGHERFSPWNRINQNGPEAMGWRATAQNLNLNRDYVKADAPEMQAWLKLWNDWQPDLLIDMHNTNGADYQYELTWAYETAGNIHPALAQWNQDVLGGRVYRAMHKRGWKLFEYITMVDDTDLGAGLLMEPSGPRYSVGYAAIANRAGLLIETHMLKDFKTRVLVNEDLLLEVLRAVAREPGRLRAAVRTAESATQKRAQENHALPLAFKLEATTREVDFLGVASTRTESPISGSTWVQYDPTQPQSRKVSVRDQVSVARSVAAPAAYLIPVQWTAIIEKLQAHGIPFVRLDAAQTVAASTYRFDQVEWAKEPFEGHLMLSRLEHSQESGTYSVPAGSVLVSTDQPRADILIHLLEPDAPDALIRWGYFNAIFESKEYAEPRVLEALARKMLAADPELKSQFEEKLKDPEFAANRWARLYFFYEKSPWFDTEYRRYPVLRLDAAATAKLKP